MDNLTQSLLLMLLKGIGVGMVAAVISILIYFGLIRDRYSNDAMTLRIQQVRALSFFGGMGIGAAIVLVLVFGGLYLLYTQHSPST